MFRKEPSLLAGLFGFRRLFRHATTLAGFRNVLNGTDLEGLRGCSRASAGRSVVRGAGGGTRAPGHLDFMTDMFRQFRSITSELVARAALIR